MRWAAACAQTARIAYTARMVAPTPPPRLPCAPLAQTANCELARGKAGPRFLLVPCGLVHGHPERTATTPKVCAHSAERPRPPPCHAPPLWRLCPPCRRRRDALCRRAVWYAGGPAAARPAAHRGPWRCLPRQVHAEPGRRLLLPSLRHERLTRSPRAEGERGRRRQRRRGACTPTPVHCAAVADLVAAHLPTPGAALASARRRTPPPPLDSISGGPAT